MASAATSAPKARFHPRRLGHGNIFVSDRALSVPFYRDICGLTRVFDEPGIKAVFFSNGSSHHDVALMEIDTERRIGRDGHVQVPKGRGTRPGLNHLGFEMETEKSLVDACQRARESGVKVSRTTDHGISHSVYLYDPDGNLLEFYADAVDDWRAFYADHRNQLISGPWDLGAGEPNTRPLYHETFGPQPVQTAPLQPRRITRATLMVSDLRGLRRFYEDVVGLDPLVEGEGFVAFAGALGEPSVALFQAPAGTKPGLHHLGFELTRTQSPQSVRERLAAVGVEPVAEVETTTTRGIVVADPDGLKLEFYWQTGSGVDAVRDPEQRLYLI